MPNHVPAAAIGLPGIIPHPILADLIARERLRKRIEGAIARLIDALDAIDAPAADLEPWLGAPEIVPLCSAAQFDQRQWANGANDDREEVDEDADPLDRGEDDTSDGEADIGAAETVDQTRWGHGSRQDGLEPSLGAPERLDQSGWGQGGRCDLEENEHA